MSRTLITGFVFSAVTIFVFLMISRADINPYGFNIAQVAEASETGIAAKREKYESELQQLLLERKRLLSNIVDSMKIFLESGRIGIGEYRDANIALLRAEMDLCQTQNERLEILQKIVQFHKENEAWMARRAADGRATHMDVDKVKVARLEAHIELARERLKLQATEPPELK